MCNDSQLLYAIIVNVKSQIWFNDSSYQKDPKNASAIARAHAALQSDNSVVTFYYMFWFQNTSNDKVAIRCQK